MANSELTDFELDAVDPDFCRPRYDLDDGWVWEDENGDPCSQDDWKGRFQEFFMKEVDDFVRDWPVIGTVWKWFTYGTVYLSGSNPERARKKALERAWGQLRLSSCEQAINLRTNEEATFLTRNGYGELLSFVAHPEWLGFDSPMAAVARQSIWRRPVAPWGLHPPVFPTPEPPLPGVRETISERAARLGTLPFFESYMRRGSGARLLTDEAAGRIWRHGRPVVRPGQNYYGPPSVFPQLPRELDERLSELCSEYLRIHGCGFSSFSTEFVTCMRESEARQEQACLLCVKGSLQTVLLYRLYGKPLGDLESGFRWIEQQYAPEIAYLRLRGKRVGREQAPPGMRFVHTFGAGSRNLRAGRGVVLQDSPTVRARQRKAAGVKKGKQANMFLLGAAALLGAVWWRRRR